MVWNVQGHALTTKRLCVQIRLALLIIYVVLLCIGSHLKLDTVIALVKGFNHLSHLELLSLRFDAKDIATFANTAKGHPALEHVRIGLTFIKCICVVVWVFISDLDRQWKWWIWRTWR